MITEVDVAYAAGLVDGEAYIGIKKSKAYKCQGRTTPGYSAVVQIRMVDEGAIRFFAESFGGWYWKEKPHSHKGRQLFCYQVSDLRAHKTLEILLPFLKVKNHQAQTVLEFRKLQADGKNHRTKITGHRNFPNKYGTNRTVPNLSFSDEYVEQC